jgi:hypothetical protein
MNPESDKTPAPYEVVRGGAKVKVCYLPNAATGETPKDEEVLVRIVPISLMAEYVDKIGSLAELVELLCEKKPGWADTLAPECVYAIDEIGRKLNDPFVGRFIERQTAAVNLMKQRAQQIAESMSSSPTR